MKFLFFIATIFMSAVLISAHADLADQLTVDSFHNKIYRWNGRELTNALVATDKIVVTEGRPVVTSTAPIFWSDKEVVLPTQRGEIYIFDLQKSALRLAYTAEGQCQSQMAFQGCIYTMIVAEFEKAYFLEHTAQNTDRLMEITPRGVRPLVNGIPGPSGPMWRNGDGRLGLLPYGLGVVDFEVPERLTEYSQLKTNLRELNTMAAYAMSGTAGDNENILIFHNYSGLQRLGQDGLKELIVTSSAAFDPCSGTIWYLTEQDVPRTLVDDPYTNLLPANPAQCPLITRWLLLEREGSTMEDTRWDVIQGLPSGEQRLPSMQVLSLGKNGHIVLESEKTIYATGGVDLRIFENAFEHQRALFTEAGRVEIENESGEWISTGCNCAFPSADVCAGMQTTRSSPGNGVLAWTDEAGGFPVNLKKLGISQAKKIRITDCGNDFPRAGVFAGFDLDAIVITPTAVKSR